MKERIPQVQQLVDKFIPERYRSAVRFEDDSIQFDAFQIREIPVERRSIRGTVTFTGFELNLVEGGEFAPDSPVVETTVNVTQSMSFEDVVRRMIVVYLDNIIKNELEEPIT